MLEHEQQRLQNWRLKILREGQGTRQVAPPAVVMASVARPSISGRSAMLSMIWQVCEIALMRRIGHGVLHQLKS